MVVFSQQIQLPNLFKIPHFVVTGLLLEEEEN
ncbi:hypothetical protein Nhal_3497 [Nitrosococcus halophilus Nc 4]|uniref:Uncharacterized protein n=1 Tax=Nitrosococcus halophilus (strain Nc4) TaxID=472759 RepID=D5C1G9_NITHN|nr:hypothetical protein Nhal_3497 [Nitrosococcus halophilus Nc 4]